MGPREADERGRQAGSEEHKAPPQPIVLLFKNPGQFPGLPRKLTIYVRGPPSPPPARSLSTQSGSEGRGTTSQSSPK